MTRALVPRRHADAGREPRDARRGGRRRPSTGSSSSAARRARARATRPAPLCPRAAAFDLDWQEVSGRGTVYTLHRRPPRLRPVARRTGCRTWSSSSRSTTRRGVRLVSNLVDADPESVRIGMAVEVVWEDVGPDLALPRFRPAG